MHALAERVVARCVRPLGLKVVRAEAFVRLQGEAGYGSVQLKAYVQSTMTTKGISVPENPRLHELAHRYEATNQGIGESPMWKSRLDRPDQLLYFRADEAYVWQGVHPRDCFMTDFYRRVEITGGRDQAARGG